VSATRAGGGPLAAAVAGGTLPFTGLSLLWVFVAALLLMLLGLGCLGLGGRRQDDES
jgi:hypothetical protein